MVNDSVVENKPVRASLVLVYFNSGKDLGSCLQSLLPTVSKQDEIILVDNGSTDGGLDGFEEHYPNIRLIRNSSNLGLGGGGNLGARFARGEYLVFLNLDTRQDGLWLEELLKVFESDPQAGLCTSKILLMDQPDQINACGNAIHLSGITLCQHAGRPSEQCSQVQEVNAVSGAAFAMRRELFQSIGGFDADFFMYMEEIDLSLRARLAGFRCYVVPGSIVYHDYQLRFGQHKVFYQERNRYLMLLKNYRWGSLLLLLPVFILAELVTWGFVVLRQPGQWKGKIAAYRWVIQHWKLIGMKRQDVQVSRRVRDASLLKSHTLRIDYEQTGKSWLARIAHWIFDPLFYTCGSIARLLIQW